MGSRDRRDRRRVTARRPLKRGEGQRIRLEPKVLFPGDMGLREPGGSSAGERYPTGGAGRA